MADNSKSPVLVFFLIVLFLCSLIWIPIAIFGSLYSANNLLLLAVMWAPGIAGLITHFKFRHYSLGLGWKWGAKRFQVIAYCAPLFSCLVVYGICWSSGAGTFSAEQFNSFMAQGLGGFELPFVLNVLFLSTVGVLINIPLVLGEEIGWRGFLVPELALRWGFTKAALASGVVWALYHYPLIIFADYGGSTHWYSLVFFTIMVVSVSFVLTWLRLISGSLWTAVLFHAAHNTFVQSLFAGLTIRSVETEHITTEFGWGMAVMYLFLGFGFWKRRNKIVTEKKGLGV